MARGRRLTLMAAGGVAVAALVAGAVVYTSAAGGPFTGTIAVGAGPAAIAIDDGSGHTFVGNAKDDTITMLDTRRGTVLRTVDAGGAPQAMAVDPRTGRIFVANSQGGSAAETGAGVAAEWIPSWLRDHLPWLSSPIGSGASTNGTVSVIGGA